MKAIQTKTLAVGLAAIAAVGFSACSSDKSDSGQQTGANPAMSTAAPGTTSAMPGPAAQPVMVWTVVRQGSPARRAALSHV